MSPHARPRILVVDDSPSDVQVLAQALARVGDVQFALSGEAAIERSRRSPPDVVQLDVMMSGIDGYETLRRMKQDPELASIPVIFVTVMGESDAEVRGLQLGAEDYISKPFQPDIVRLRVSHLLERLRLGRQLALALRGARQGLWDWDLASGCVALGNSWTAPLGDGEQDPAPTELAWDRLVHPEDQAAFRAVLENAPGSTPFEVEARLRRQDGAWMWCHISAEALERGPHGAPMHLLGTFMDISRRKHAEHELMARESDLSALIQSMPDTLIVCDSEGSIERCHSARGSVFLRPIEAVLGSHYTEVLPQAVVTRIERSLSGLEERDRAVEFQVEVSDEAGSHHFDVILARMAGDLDGERRLLLVARDITPLRIMEETIQHLAFHDALTELPNRRLLFDRLQDVLIANKRTRHYAAVMFIDLDLFKPVNDAHGHEAGDALLRETARRLRNAVRESDTVARMGGDEFVIVLKDLDRSAPGARAHADAVCEKVLANLQPPMQWGAHRLYCSASIGVRIFGGDDNATELLRDADTAMYVAKKRGGGGAHFHPFDSDDLP